MKNLQHPKKGIAAFLNQIIKSTKQVKGGTDAEIIVYEDAGVL